MATTPTVGTRTTLTVTNLGTLPSATYITSAIFTANTDKPWDVIVEVDVATTNTPAGNKQVVVFIQESLDGTNFRSGPTSGVSALGEPTLLRIGSVPMNSVTTSQAGTFSVAQALGYCPFAFKVVLKNDLGVALTSGTVFTSEITG